MYDILQKQAAESIIHKCAAIAEHNHHIEHMKANGNEKQDLHWPDHRCERRLVYDGVKVVEHHSHPACVQYYLDSLHCCDASVL